jgi:hypothetical protein
MLYSGPKGSGSIYLSERFIVPDHTFLDYLSPPQFPPSNPEDQAISSTFCVQDLYALAKGVPYLPSGLYESRMIHPSPQGRVNGVS